MKKSFIAVTLLYFLLESISLNAQYSPTSAYSQNPTIAIGYTVLVANIGFSEIKNMILLK